MNVLVDSAIYSLQQYGGISRLWRSLSPALRIAMPDATFAPSLPPEVFVSTYYAPAPLGARSLALVYDVIPFKYPGLPNQADSADIRRAVSEAAAVVSISDQTARDVQRFLGKSSVVAYPGVEADFGRVPPSAVERFQAQIGRPYLLVVGRRGLYKNVQALYQAWGLWGPRTQFKIVCVGGEEPTIADLTFARRYPDTWQRLTLNDDDLRAAYAGARALVYPSLMEGFGLPVLEALACACPVVGDKTVIGEAAGEAGFYADVTKPCDVSAALDATLDYGIRLERITRGVERATAFTWARMAGVVADALRRAA